jgi:site-specific DNA-methyltransferase (adenine-specific)
VLSGAEKWDIVPTDDYFLELFRVSANQIIWGGNFFDIGPTKQPICWNKLRPNQKNLSEWEMAWTSFEGRARMFTYCANGGFVSKEKRIHPTQKPVKLYQWLLENYAEKGQRILDTHLGSGSSAIAAHYFGCDFVGCEIDKDYFEAAKKRIDLKTRQLSLF